MVRLRLQRFGAKREPHYRIVAADQRKARNGRIIEELGTYNPNQEPPEIRMNYERVEYWLDNGAQPTDTVNSFVERMREDVAHVVDLSKEGADEAYRERKREARRKKIEERRQQLAESAAETREEAEADEADDEVEAEAGEEPEAEAGDEPEAEADEVDETAEADDGGSEATEADTDADDTEADESEKTDES